MRSTWFPSLKVLASALLLLASCATTQPSPAPPRTKDSAPEKVAAQRSAAPHGLQLEQDDERWGFEAARERRRQRDAAKASKQPTASDKAVDVTAPPAR
jgi:hypothetical protein